MKNKNMILSAALLLSPAALFAQVVQVPGTGIAPVGGAAGASYNAAPGRSLALAGPALSAPSLGGSLILKAAPSPVAVKNPGAAAVFQAPGAVAAPESLSEIPAFQAPAPSFGEAPALAAPRQAQKEAEKRPSIISRLTRAVKTTLDFRRVFDSGSRSTLVSEVGVTSKPLKPIKLPQGIELDPAPAPPKPTQVPTVSINSFEEFGDFESAEIPGTVNSGGVFDNGPVVLEADPSSEADMERALRALVTASPERYGITGADLTAIHVRRVEGKAHQADTFFGLFRQQKNGIVVHDSSLSFTVKVLSGKPVLIASMAKLYKNLAVETASPFSDEDLRTRAQQRIGLPPEMASEMTFVGKKIIFSNGSWHAAALYSISGLPVMIAVDVATGEAFAWDARQAFQEDGAAKKTGAGNLVLGRGEADDKRPDGKPVLVPLPMTNLTITLADGKTVTTDKDGKFVVQGKEGVEISFGAALEGTWAKVTDSQGRVLKLNGTAKPGTDGKYVYNPTEADEWILNMINSFQGVNRVHDWLKERFNDPRIDKAIPVNANIDQECNAYYTPGSPSLNFFKSSEMCSDTARPGIIAHEYGHFWDDMIGGIVNGGLSEGWGDILSMYIFGSPIIGDGFLKNPSLLDNMRDVFWSFLRKIRGVEGEGARRGPRPSYIRNGENDYQYKPYDEVHDQGQAWMGFAWKLRVALIESLGAAAGAAIAEALVIPTMFAKATDIPSAMAQVLLNDMDKTGAMPHEAQIRAAAKAHGITLPKNPGALALKLAQLAGDGLTGN